MEGVDDYTVAEKTTAGMREAPQRAVSKTPRNVSACPSTLGDGISMVEQDVIISTAGDLQLAALGNLLWTATSFRYIPSDVLSRDLDRASPAEREARSATSYCQDRHKLSFAYLQ